MEARTKQDPASKGVRRKFTPNPRLGNLLHKTQLNGSKFRHLEIGPEKTGRNDKKTQHRKRRRAPNAWLCRRRGLSPHCPGCRMARSAPSGETETAIDLGRPSVQRALRRGSAGAGVQLRGRCGPLATRGDVSGLIYSRLCRPP
jgi:hypothetical protein